MEEKIAHAKELIKDTVKKYKRTAVACSFGKDSMVTVHLAREVDPHIPIFSIMTPYKPRETFDYLKEMNRQMNLDVTVYIVSDSIPEAFQDNNLDLRLLPHEEFHRTASKIKDEKGSEIYDVDPDECCRLLKVEPTIIAVKYLDAWICGLRNTEGRVRENYQEVEDYIHGIQQSFQTGEDIGH